MIRFNLALIIFMLLFTAKGEESFIDMFHQNSDWRPAGELTPIRGGYKVEKEGRKLIYAVDRRNLVSKQAYKDCSFKMEFQLNNYGGVFFQSRYEIQLARREKGKNLTGRTSGAIFYQKAPDVDAIGEIVDWQTLEVEFRAPRFSADGYKISEAMFTKVILNGKLIHKNVSVPKPTSKAPFANETEMAPIALEGGIGSIAIRKLEIKSIDLSHIETKKLSKEESIPLDKFFSRY